MMVVSPDEHTLLLPHDNVSPSLNRRVPKRKPRRLHWSQYLVHYSIGLLMACLVVLVEYQQVDEHGYMMEVGGRRTTRAMVTFPDDFVWGSATSAYQIEGGSDARGTSIWDTFTENEVNILDASSGEVACDHYNRMEEDVALMKKLRLQAYRFSIAWTRLVPSGKVQDGINEEGVDFYNRLIDALLDAGITPYVTLFHWDLPQRLEDEYGGWLSHHVVDDFTNYARLCFQLFGDRVQHWITLNESWTVAVNGYNNHVHAPGHSKHPGTETYLAAHHLLLSHAHAVQVYRTEFHHHHKGVIGIANCADFRYPADYDKEEDHEAAERAMIFQLGWFADPIWFGDYPDEMKERLGHRLPRFSHEERRLLKGSSDFFGLNHYSSLLAAEPTEKPNYEGYWADMFVDFSSRDEWLTNDMGWSIVPKGCRDLLLWISHRYKDPAIIMTENGSAENEPNLETAVHDEARRHYFETYLAASAQAIAEGVDLRGYFAWSLMDNFEWQFGYQRRFGLVRVDFTTQERTLKGSAHWYRKTIKMNGRNIPKHPASVYE